ncbi:MAG: hypothetical protein A2Y14_02690 [Verrucomicrobia bacterium GWF2_51_19]|nr:MAG: hypothetical protein A2Y14_02690 [Verrucomicrobia bacterium GWF2_51_19]HCJ12249.1 hypothetical protein [Opitutae bacterium]
MKFVYRFFLGCCLFILSGCETFKSSSQTTTRLESSYYRIEAPGQATSDQMSSFLVNNNKELSPQFTSFLASVYIEECADEGINADIAFCQMCHETNFLKFGNQVHIRQNNFAGLGATDDGARGIRFPSVRAGVRAHVQHLKAYASYAPLQKATIDPRFSKVVRGSAPTLFDLSGKWATDSQYAYKIEEKLYNLYNPPNTFSSFIAQINPFGK